MPCLSLGYLAAFSQSQLSLYETHLSSVLSSVLYQDQVYLRFHKCRHVPSIDQHPLSCIHHQHRLLLPALPLWNNVSRLYVTVCYVFINYLAVDTNYLAGSTFLVGGT